MKEDRRKYRWYLADIIKYPIITDKTTKRILVFNSNLYYNNSILIKARNEEEAYKKANKFSKESEIDYMNTDGNKVEWKFAGVRELVEIYDKLEDGSEIAYSEGHTRSIKNLLKKIPPKHKLGVFELKLRQEREKKKAKSKR